MRKQICIILAVMMLTLCGCGSGDESSSADTSSHSIEYEYTEKHNINNVSFCVPKECEETAGDDGTVYYYYPDNSLIMTSVHKYSYGGHIHSDSTIESLTDGIKEAKGVTVLGQEKTFIGDTPILLIKLKIELQEETSYSYSAYMMSDEHLIQLGTNSLDPDDAKAKYDALADTVQIDEQAAGSKSDAQITDSGRIFVKRIYETDFSYCVPEDAAESTRSSGTGYEGSKAALLLSSTTIAPDLTDDSWLYQLFGSYDFERETVNGVTVVKAITVNEGKFFGWVVFNYLGKNHTIGITSRINAVSYSVVKDLRDEFFETLRILS